MSKQAHQMVTRARRHKLTPREAEIVARLAEGEKRESVAGELKISRHTLDTHVRRAFAKLRLHSITAVVFFLSY